MRYILFDLDGTLTDPAEGITNSVAYALRRYGIEVSDTSELNCFIGPPLTDSFERFYGFSHEKAVEAVEVYREYFRPTGIFENKVFNIINKINFKKFIFSLNIIWICGNERLYSNSQFLIPM